MTPAGAANRIHQYRSFELHALVCVESWLYSSLTTMSASRVEHPSVGAPVRRRADHDIRWHPEPPALEIAPRLCTGNLVCAQWETVMTLQELRYLVALADKGHFARAAETCNVGQPTLSTQLKKLEEYLGVTLFERNKHHLQATPIGEQIIAQARIALSVVAQIKELARRGVDSMEVTLLEGVH